MPTYAVAIYNSYTGEHTIRVTITARVRDAILAHPMCPFDQDPERDEYDSDLDYENACEETLECPSSLEAAQELAGEYECSIAVLELQVENLQPTTGLSR